MQRVDDAIYLSADKIETLIRRRMSTAEQLPDRGQRQSAFKDIERLRMYADAKRWIASPGLKPRE